MYPFTDFRSRGALGLPIGLQSGIASAESEGFAYLVVSRWGWAGGAIPVQKHAHGVMANEWVVVAGATAMGDVMVWRWSAMLGSR